MKIAKYATLAFLSLLVFVLCGAAVIKLFDMLLALHMEDIWTVGAKAGFLAWLVLLAGFVIRLARRKG